MPSRGAAGWALQSVEVRLDLDAPDEYEELSDDADETLEWFDRGSLGFPRVPELSGEYEEYDDRAEEERDAIETTLPTYDCDSYDCESTPVVTYVPWFETQTARILASSVNVSTNPSSSGLPMLSGGVSVMTSPEPPVSTK